MRVTRTALWSAMVVCAGLVLLPRGLAVLGLQPVVVAGGSMAPTYLAGEVVLLGSPSGHDLRLDDVVAVSVAGSTYLHRVVETGGNRAKLRGDANRVVDPDWVREDHVVGVPAFRIPRPAATVMIAAASFTGRLGLALAALASGLILAVSRPRPRQVADPYS